MLGNVLSRSTRSSDLVIDECLTDPRARLAFRGLTPRPALPDVWRWLYTLLQIGKPRHAVSLGRPRLAELLVVASAVSDAGGRSLTCLTADSPCHLAWSQTLASAGLDWLVRFRRSVDGLSHQQVDLLLIQVDADLAGLAQLSLGRNALVIGFGPLGPTVRERLAERSAASGSVLRVLHPPGESSPVWVASLTKAGVSGYV